MPGGQEAEREAAARHATERRILRRCRAAGDRLERAPSQADADAILADKSAETPKVLRRTAALPSLRTLPLHRGLATVDDQAVALSSTLAAYGAVPQSRTTTGHAGRREFFIHFVSLHLSGRQHTPPAVVPARDKLPKDCIAQCCRRRWDLLQRTVWADADCPGVVVRRRQTSPHDPYGNLRRHAHPVLRFSERARPARRVGDGHGCGGGLYSARGLYSFLAALNIKSF